MDKLVKMTISDDNGNILKEGYVAVTNEFLEQSDIENHLISSPEYAEETQYKADLFDELLSFSSSENFLVYGAAAKALVDRFELNKEFGCDEHSRN
ncbi:TPA: hypothetical protein L4H46_006328 [Pseudomonas aeruginosa]|nr:hypothetical protein [Pseudomonas aeruginosa]